MNLSRRQFGLAAAALAAPTLARAQAPKRGVTVVELFTSQLCPGCPVADAYLIELAKRDNLIPLSFSVTHYDHGGFKDPFGQKDFDRRQFSYATRMRRESAFTPQMVVNGKADAPGLAIDFVEELLAGAELDGPVIAFQPGAVEIAEAPSPYEPAEVVAIHYDPRVVRTPVRGLEDRSLPHINVVHALHRLGDWTGPRVRYAAPPVPPGLKRAVLLQTENTGPILAAARG